MEKREDPFKYNISRTTIIFIVFSATGGTDQLSFGAFYIYIYPNGPATFPLGKIKYLAALVVCPAGSNTVRKSTADILYSFETRVLGIEITGREGEQECYVLHALSRNFAPIKVQRGKKSANKRIVLPVAPRLKTFRNAAPF